MDEFGILAAVLSGFVLAAFAPWIYRLAGGATGWLLALLPVGLFVYFAGTAGLRLADAPILWPEPTALPAEGVVESHPWAASFGLRLSFLLDGLSLLFALLISGIGALILIYAGGYMGKKPTVGRLYALLLMFMASMLGLVLADNVLTLFVFWELTSISSYLLIGFDHERPQARAAALQALLVTGGGGLALLAGLLLLGQVGVAAGLADGDQFELSSLIHLGDAVRDHALYLPVLVLVLCGALTKSAQFPFHFWLPSAMEAPTPVSAYLHSATMVKAGVYLLARLSPALSGTDAWIWAVSGFGLATMLVGALLGVQERDMKRILAQSTVSALGVLVFLLGIGTPDAAMAMVVFLLAHAMYKGALFLVAGGVDHATGTRNVSELAGLARVMPITAAAAVFAALAMAAVPPLFGFIAKEMFYEAALRTPAAVPITTAVVFASMLFVAMAGMVGVRPFLGRRSPAAAHAHEGSAGLWFGPVVLALGGLMLGLFPGMVDLELLSPAARAVLGVEETEPKELVLWHGWTLALGLSMLTLAGGIALYAGRERLRRLLAPVSQHGPAQGYDVGLAGLIRVANVQTAILQSGYLRYYLLIILLSAVSLLAYTVHVRGDLMPTLAWGEIRFYELALVALIPLALIVTVRARSRLSAIAALGVVGYAMALIFVLFGAPDLAMTQFLVETLTVILFILAFYHLPPDVLLSSRAARFRDGVVALLVGGMMTMLVLFAVDEPYFPAVSYYFERESLPLGHGRNIVNVILVDFRALDTLGEITVLGIAGVGVYALLKLRPPGRTPS